MLVATDLLRAHRHKFRILNGHTICGIGIVSPYRIGIVEHGQQCVHPDFISRQVEKPLGLYR